jgi:co-chaperonin GroES (HSP10)
MKVIPLHDRVLLKRLEKQEVNRLVCLLLFKVFI